MNLNVSFAFPQQLSSSSKFTQPSIAVNGNDDCLLFYNSGSSVYYNTGKLSGCYCKFGKSKSFAKTIGILPSVSLNNNNSCMLAYAYAASSDTQTIVIDYCTLKDGSVNISKATSSWVQVADALNPSIAINNNGLFLEAHQNTLNGTLGYMAGTVNSANNTISYFNGTPQGFSFNGLTLTGAIPAVALNDQGQFVLAYQSGNTLNCLAGSIKNNIVSCGQPFPLAVGLTGFYSISIALSNQGNVIMTYVIDNTNPNNPDNPVKPGFYKAVGTITPGGATNPLFSQFEPISDAVVYGSVAMALNTRTNKNVVMLAQQQTASSASSINYTGSYLMSRANWMGSSLNSPLASMQLRNIVMPASHDASMYIAQDCTTGGKPGNTITQTGTIKDQLNAGIRYFDIRPVYKNGSFITGHFFHGHGCYGPQLSAILNDVSSFISANKELVILKFSHINFNGADTVQVFEELIQTVTAKLGNYLFKKNPNPNIANSTLNTFLNGKSASGIVLPVFSDIPDSVMTKYQGKGIYSYVDYEVKIFNKPNADLIVYDDYANTSALNTMITNQTQKMLNSSNHPSNGLFLLSWTLTSSKPTILSGAYKANQALWPQMVKNSAKIFDYKKHNLIPNLLYIDACEGFVTDVAVWLNAGLSK